MVHDALHYYFSSWYLNVSEKHHQECILSDEPWDIWLRIRCCAVVYFCNDILRFLATYFPCDHSIHWPWHQGTRQNDQLFLMWPKSTFRLTFDGSYFFPHQCGKKWEQMWKLLHVSNLHHTHMHGVFLFLWRVMTYLLYHIHQKIDEWNWFFHGTNSDSDNVLLSITIKK